MKGNRLAIILVIAGIALIMWYALWGDQPIHWAENYHTSEMQPYDLRIFYDLLDSSTTDEVTWLQNELRHELAGKNGYNYVIVSSRIYMDTVNADTLISFIERGNYGFIAQYNSGEKLFQMLDKRGYGYMYLNSVAGWNITAGFHKRKGKRKYEFRYYNPVQYTHNWVYYDDLGVDEVNKKLNKLGYFKTDNSNEEFCNFYYLQIGKGRLYFFTNPILLTNFFMTKESGFNYAGVLMEELPDRPVLLDNYHRYYHVPTTGGDVKSPLKFIFSQPSLTYAWYTLLGGFFLFFAFRIKREQRVIPLLPSVENTSIEFSKSLGALYHQAGSPKFITVEMMKLFDNYNRRNFGINRKPADEKFAERIARKSKADKELVSHILTLEIKIMYNPKPHMKEIIPLYQALDEYYQKTRP